MLKNLNKYKENDSSRLEQRQYLKHENMIRLRKINPLLFITTFQALNSTKTCVEISEEQICKVNTEFHFIQSLYYQEMQQTPHVTIVLDGVKEDQLPQVFRRRIHARFPKTFHSDDDDAQRLVGLVLDEEPLRLV